MGFLKRIAVGFWNWLKKLWGKQFYLCDSLYTYTLFFALGFLIFLAFNLLPALYNFKEIAIEDIDVSDLYYQSQPASTKDKFIIVNTGTIPQDSLSGKRRALVNLVNAINHQQPERIGVDLYFDEPRKDTKTDTVLRTLLHKENIVLATDGVSELNSFEEYFLRDKTNLGYIIIPPKEHTTIREYYNYGGKPTINSFANECAGIPLDTEQDSCFLLKYSVKGKGFYNVQKDTITQDDVFFAFPAVEATYVLENSNNKQLLHDLFHDKIVLLGHLGVDDMNNPYDIDDKHKTPTEKEFISKRPIMPGVVIHANAIAQKIAQPKVSLFGITGWLEVLVIFWFVFGYHRLSKRLHNDRILVNLAFELALPIVTFFFVYWSCYYLMFYNIHFNPLHLIVAFVLRAELASSMDKFEEKLKPETATKNKEP